MAEGCTLPSWQPPTIPNCSGSAPKRVAPTLFMDRDTLRPPKNSPHHAAWPSPASLQREAWAVHQKRYFLGKKMRQKRFQGLKTPSHRSLAIQGWAGWFVSVADTHSHFSGRYKYRSF